MPGIDSELYLVSPCSPECDSSTTTENTTKPIPPPFSRPVLKVSTNEKDAIEAIQKEIDIHHRINLSSSSTRQRLVQGVPVRVVTSLKDAHQSSDPCCFNGIVMPRMDTNLHRYMNWRGSAIGSGTTVGVTSEVVDEAKAVINQVHSGLKQLHAMNIIHADLSTGNVLIRLSPCSDQCPVEAYLADFGNCRFIGADLREFHRSEYVLYIHPDQFTLEGSGKRRSSDCPSSSRTNKRQKGGHSKTSSLSISELLPAPAPKASERFDAWSYGVLALNMLMQLTRRCDRHIDKWSTDVSGMDVYKLVTGNQHDFKLRVHHVTDTFASTVPYDAKDKRSVIRDAWCALITSALCLHKADTRGAATSTPPSLPNESGGTGRGQEAQAARLIPLKL